MDNFEAFKMYLSRDEGVRRENVVNKEGIKQMTESAIEGRRGMGKRSGTLDETKGRIDYDKIKEIKVWTNKPLSSKINISKEIAFSPKPVNIFISFLVYPIIL